MLYVIAVLLPLCFHSDRSLSTSLVTQDDSVPQIIKNLKNGDKGSRAQAIKKVKELGPRASSPLKKAYSDR